MKRHEALAPLSRDHHGSLILAQLLKRGAPAYKGLPLDNAGKVKYAIQQFDQHIQKHFEQEGRLLEITTPYHPDIKRLGKEIKDEHTKLTALFRSLFNTGNEEDVMDELGRLLETHIRKEERELFPLLQQHCPAGLMQQVYDLLH